MRTIILLHRNSLLNRTNILYYRLLFLILINLNKKNSVELKLHSTFIDTRADNILLSIYSMSKEIYYSILFLLKMCSILYYNSILDVCAVDNLNNYTAFIKNNNMSRFSLVYILVSYYWNIYFNVKITYVDNKNNIYYFYSLTNIFANTNWIEREIWEMFGIFFFFHKDLRRLLTDYSFTGFPLRKDFPLSGYVEVRYDDSINHIIYEPVALTQAYRYFVFQNPWLKKTNDKN